MDACQLVSSDKIAGAWPQEGQFAETTSQASGGGERVAKANCSMECGLRLPVAEMYRSNARALPVCLPCQNAKRTLIAMANKTPACKEALNKLQAEDPDGWKARVRACRIVDPSAIAAGADCVAALAARRQVLFHLISEVKQTMGVQEVSAVLWLNKLQFIKHHADLGGPSREEAAALFDQRVRDPTVTKMNREGDEVRIGLMDIPRTEVYRSRETSEAIRGQVVIESKAQADDAVRKMSEVGVGAKSVSSPMFGDLSDAFRAGNTVGSSTGQPLPLGSVKPPPCNLVIPPSTFDGPAPRRSLSAAISDPQDDVLATHKKRRTGPLAGVTGDLLEFRQQGLDTFARIWDIWGKGSNNRARALLLADKRGELSEDVSRALKTYSDTLARARTAQASIKNWVLANAQNNLEELAAMATDLEELGEKLDKAHELMVTSRESTRKALAKKRADDAKERSRLTAVFKGKAPENILRYLYDKGALVATSDTSGGLDSMEDSQETGNAVAVELASNWPRVGGEDTSFDHEMPAFFPPCSGKGDSVAARVRQIPQALGHERIAKAHQDSVRSLSRPGQISGQGVRRLEPGAGSDDKLEDLDWVPEQFKATQAKPKKLSDFGAPSLLTDQMGECRRGIKAWPMVGLGQFAVQVKGESTLLCWPAAAVLDKGCPLDLQWTFLFEDLSHKQFCEFADEHCRYVALTLGGAVWIPYGWYVVSMSRPSVDTSSGILVQPFVTDVLAASCKVWPDVKNLLVAQMGHLVTTGAKVWKDMAPRAIEWLHTANESNALDAPRAIEDMKNKNVQAIQDATGAEANEDKSDEKDAEQDEGEPGDEEDMPGHEKAGDLS